MNHVISAQKLYEKLGYKVTARWPSVAPTHNSRIDMKKTLEVDADYSE